MIGRLKIVVGQAVQLVAEQDARILHRLLCTLAAHHAGITGDRTAQHCDLTMPLLDEVVHSSVGCSAVIHAHHGKIGKVQLVGDQCGQHRGDCDVGKAFFEVGYAAAQKDHTFGLDLPQDLFGGIDLVGVFIQIGNDAIVAIQGGGPLQLD